jgi:hypothetical protein
MFRRLARATAALLDRPWVALVSLYGIQVSLILALVVAAGRQQVLTKEEASITFVYPTFLQLRLQHHLYASDFYGYAFYAGAVHAVHLMPGFLFYGRFAKAAMMGFLPPILYLYLRRRFSWTGSQAFPAAVAIGLLPGVIDFSWIGSEWGFELLAGFFALWLALFESPLAVVGSCAAVALAAGSYASGFAFIPVVLFHQLPRLRKPELKGAVIAGGILAAAVLLFPVYWWTNIQALYLGGGERPVIAGAIGRVSDLFHELFVRGGSYYFFSNGEPALGGLVIGIVSLAGMAAMMIRGRARSWPILVIAAGTIAIYAAAGNVIGIRRALPLVVSLGIGAIFLLRMTTGGGPVRQFVFYGLLSAAILLELAQFNDVRRGLATAEIPLPRDWDFPIPPGETMATEIAALANRSRKLPDDLNGYEPDRTLSILYQLTLPHPIVTASELVAQCDQHGWSVPSTSPRLLRFRKRLFGKQ